MEFSSSSNKPCCIEENYGSASLADMEAGFSANRHPFFSRSLRYARRGSFRNLSSMVSSPRSARFCDSRYKDHQRHFLEACYLCKKPLGDNKDIFMYRGDTPFCSEDCRQEQIDKDEAKEKNWNLSSSMKALRKKDQKKHASPTKTQEYSSRTGTVAAA